jgi:crossover junction endodeoxyribonuclease RusA
MQLIQLHLPYPPSTNRYWRTFRGRPVPSKEATEFKRIVKEASKQQDLYNGITWNELYAGDVEVTIQLLPKLTAAGIASKVCIDLDNCLKVLLDAIQGTCIEDDKQVKRIAAAYGEPIKDGGVIVTVCKMK